MEVVGEMDAGGLGRLVCDVGLMGCMSAMVFRRRRNQHRCGRLQHTNDGLNYRKLVSKSVFSIRRVYHTS